MTLMAGVLLWGTPFQVLSTEFKDAIVAIVNKEVITFSELQAELADELKRLRARYQGDDLRHRTAQKSYQVLNSLIEHRLQLQEAEAKGLTVTDEEVTKALQRATPRTAESGMDEARLRKRIREQLLLEKLWDFEVRRLVMVSDAEIVRYYEQHPEKFLIPPAYRLRQILLLIGPDADEDAVRDRAENLYRSIHNLQDFSAVALAKSEGPEASEGGALGVVRADELLAPLAQTLRTMKPGEISRPIRSRLGYHIVALEEVIPSKPRPLEDVEAEIKAYLFRKRSQQAFQQWLATLKQKAFIEIRFSSP